MKINVVKERCKSCGYCIKFCPKNVLEKDEDGQPFAARPEDCIGCRLCEMRCPDFAISVEDGKEARA